MRCATSARSGCTVTRDSYQAWPRGYIRQPEHTNALAFLPDVVICNLGINDVSTFADGCRKDLVRDYREIIAAYRALPTAPRFVLWHPLAPLYSRAGVITGSRSSPTSTTSFTRSWS